MDRYISQFKEPRNKLEESKQGLAEEQKKKKTGQSLLHNET